MQTISEKATLKIKSPIKESEPIDKVAKKIMAHVKSEISSKVKDKHAVLQGPPLRASKNIYAQVFIYLKVITLSFSLM